MGNLKISDLVDPQALQDLKDLNDKLGVAKDNYAEAAKELAKGIKIKIEGLDDLEKLQTIISTNAKKADDAAKQMNSTMAEQKKVVSQTTNAISRELAEIEKENKEKRKSYDLNKKALDIAHDLLGTQQQNLRQLAMINSELKDNASAQKKLNDAEKDGSISAKDLIAKRASLLAEEQRLKTAKQDLNKIINNEEKMNQAAEGSYKKLSLQLEMLKKAYKELNEEEKSGSNGKILSEEISKLDAHLKDLAADMGEFQRNVGNYAIAQNGYSESIQQHMFSVMGVNEQLGSSLMALTDTGSEGFAKLKENVSAFGSALWGLLKNPKVLALLGIGGTAIAFKWLYDYNKGIAEATRLTQQFTKAQGEQLQNQRTDVQALADHYGKDFRETLEAINAVSKQFGISFEEAFAHVKDGFISGADVNEEFLDNLKEYPAYFKEAGISASEFIAITTQANQEGIYSDKGIDIIKEGNLRIREMTKATEDAMKGIGLNTDKIKKDMKSGLLSTFDVIKMVSAKLETLPATSTEVGTAIADIFGGPGEDAGLQYILTLKDIETNLGVVKDKAGEMATLEEQQLNAEQELQKAVADVFDLTNGTYEELTTTIKVGLMKALTGLLHIVRDLTTFVKEHRNILSFLGATYLAVTAYAKAHSIAVAVMTAKTYAATAATKVFNAVIAAGKPMILLFTAAFNLLTGNLGRATAAMKVFNLAVKSNPIGIALTAITTIIGALALFSTKANAASRATRGLSQEVSSMDRIQKKANDSTQKEITRVESLVNIVNSSTASYEKKKSALLELQKIVPNFHAALGNELKLTKENTKAIGDYIQQLGNKAKAEAYYEELVDLNKRLREAKRKESAKQNNIKAVDNYMKAHKDQYKSDYGAIYSTFNTSFGAQSVYAGEGERNKALLDKLDERKVHEEALNVAMRERIKIENELKVVNRSLQDDKGVLPFFESLVLGNGDDNYDGGESATKEEENYRKKIIEALQQSELDLMDEGYEKAIKSMNVAHEKKMEEIKGNSAKEQQLRKNLTEIHEKELAQYNLAYNEARTKLDIKNKLESVKEGSKEELDLKLQLLDIEREAEIRAAERTGADTTGIEEKYNSKRISMKESFVRKRIELIEEEYSYEEARANVAFIKEQAALGKRYADGLITKEEYEKQKADLTEKYAIQSSQRTIDMLQSQLDTDNLTAEQRKKIEKDLSLAKANQEKMIADNMISETERQKEADDALAKSRLDNTKKYLDYTSQAMNAINELMSSVYEGQISRLEEQTQANEDACDREIERIEHLEEIGAISKEDAEERKRKAEATTQAKNEEIERKKRKIQMKQAIWNKANQLAQTGIATARGIMEALAALNPGLASFIGIMGAIQAATIIATPIPKYAKGTDFHPGGLALVGDGGREEVVMYDGKAFVTSDKPTLVNLPRGAEVLPDVKMLQDSKLFQNLTMSAEGMTPNVVVNNDYSVLEKLNRESARLLKCLIIQQGRLAYRQQYSNYKSQI